MAREALPGSHSVWPSENRSQVITTEEVAGFTIKLWNITDFDNITLQGEYLGPNQLAHNAQFKDNIIYISHYASGIAIVEVCPNGLEELVAVDTWPINNSTNFEGGWGTRSQ